MKACDDALKAEVDRIQGDFKRPMDAEAQKRWTARMEAAVRRGKACEDEASGRNADARRTAHEQKCKSEYLARLAALDKRKSELVGFDKDELRKLRQEQNKVSDDFRACANNPPR